MVSRTKTLSKSQSMILPFIRQAVAAGTSATALYNTTRGTELGVRKTWLLDAYRQEAGIVKAGYAIQNVRHDYFANFAKLPYAINDTRSLYTMHVATGWRGEYAENGVDKIYDAVWVGSNKPQTTQWFLDKASEYAVENVVNESGEPAEAIEPIIIGSVQRDPQYN